MNVFERTAIFSILVTEIVVKDIMLSFGIVFLFVLLSFSSAIHLLRTDAHLGRQNFTDTMYNLFASALTTGDFMKETSLKSNNDKDYIPLLQAMFAMYLCCTTIILLNILISMINSRYDERRKIVRNIWTFQTLHTWILLHRLFRLSPNNIVRLVRLHFKLFKLFAGYDEVSITEDGDRVLLHLTYTRNKKNNENQEVE